MATVEVEAYQLTPAEYQAITDHAWAGETCPACQGLLQSIQQDKEGNTFIYPNSDQAQHMSDLFGYSAAPYGATTGYLDPEDPSWQRSVEHIAERQKGGELGTFGPQSGMVRGEPTRDEWQITSYLDSLGVKYVHKMKLGEIDPTETAKPKVEYDIYLPQYLIAIETSPGWHIGGKSQQSFPQVIENDKYKSNFAQEHGIDLVAFDPSEGTESFINNELVPRLLSVGVKAYQVPKSEVISQHEWNEPMGGAPAYQEQDDYWSRQKAPYHCSDPGCGRLLEWCEDCDSHHHAGPSWMQEHIELQKAMKTPYFEEEESEMMLACPHCGWEGRSDEAQESIGKRGRLEYQCPQCGQKDRAMRMGQLYYDLHPEELGKVKEPKPHDPTDYSWYMAPYEMPQSEPEPEPQPQTQMEPDISSRTVMSPYQEASLNQGQNLPLFPSRGKVNTVNQGGEGKALEFPNHLFHEENKGYRIEGYSSSEVTDAKKVIEYEVKELGNIHVLIEALQAFGLEIPLESDEDVEAGLNILFDAIDRKFGPDAQAIWLVDTAEGAKERYGFTADGETLGEPSEYDVPSDAVVISNLGPEEGKLYLMKSEEDHFNSGFAQVGEVGDFFLHKSNATQGRGQESPMQTNYGYQEELPSCPDCGNSEVYYDNQTEKYRCPDCGWHGIPRRKAYGYSEPIKQEESNLLTKLADAYNAENGFKPIDESVKSKKLDEKVGEQVAETFDAAEHDPADPKVKAAYEALKEESLAQWQFAKANGYKLEESKEDPYDNYKEMMEDLTENHTLKVYSEGNPLPKDHPLAEESPEGVTYNVIFRGIHDLFGHAAHDNTFDNFEGEFAAFLCHMQMFSEEARGAMATETLAQTEWQEYIGGVGNYPDQKAIFTEIPSELISTAKKEEEQDTLERDLESEISSFAQLYSFSTPEGNPIPQNTDDLLEAIGTWGYIVGEIPVEEAKGGDLIDTFGGYTTVPPMVIIYKDGRVELPKREEYPTTDQRSEKGNPLAKSPMVFRHVG